MLLFGQFALVAPEIRRFRDITEPPVTLTLKVPVVVPKSVEKLENESVDISDVLYDAGRVTPDHALGAERPEVPLSAQVCIAVVTGSRDWNVRLVAKNAVGNNLPTLILLE